MQYAAIELITPDVLHETGFLCQCTFKTETTLLEDSIIPERQSLGVRGTNAVVV